MPQFNFQTGYSISAPGTAHPAYEDVKKQIADWIDGDKNHLQLYWPYREAFNFSLDEDDCLLHTAIKAHILNRRKCVAMAPFVGRPFMYSWHVGVDELGRWVSGNETRLVHVVDEVKWYMTLDAIEAAYPHAHTINQELSCDNDVC